jgi:hypothetical protein
MVAGLSRTSASFACIGTKEARRALARRAVSLRYHQHCIGCIAGKIHGIQVNDTVLRFALYRGARTLSLAL